MADIITNEIEIQPGAVSSGLSVGPNGVVTVLSGATVTDASASEYGFFWVEKDGLVRDIYLHDSGDVFLNGGRAENVTMETGGQADVMEGVLHTGRILNGGVGVVYGGASALDIAVSDGGRFLVYGGYAADAVITSGGSFVIQTSGGVAANLAVSSGGHARVVSGAQGSRVTLNGGRLDMLLGYMYDTTVSSGGRMEIMSGQAHNTEICEGGSMLVSRSGDAYAVALKGGRLDVESGVLYDAEISAGAAVLRETLAVRMNMAGGSVQALGSTLVREAVLNGGELTLGSGAVVSGAQFNGVALSAEAGAAVYDGVLNADLSVTSGVTFSGTTVNSATMSVEAGAIVASTTVTDGGTLSVLGSANVSDTTVRAGGLLVLENGSAQGVLVSGYSAGSNSSQIILYPVGGEVADGGGEVTLGGDDPASSEEEVSSAPARMLVSSGGLATNVTVSCGTVGVSGGLVSGLTMDKGQIVIGSGGVVRGAVLKGVVSSSGRIFIINPTDLTFSTDTTTDPTNYLLTGGGGSYSGVPFLTGDGMSYLPVEGGAGGAVGGILDISPDGPIPIIFNPDDPGTIILYPTTPIYINTAEPAEGFLTVSSGGLLEDAQASAMQITVSGGGIVRNLSATDYTRVTLESGGTLTGRMSFVSGTTVTVSSGGIVDFDLSALAPGNQVLLTGTGSIQGAPLYTITVSADQAAGRYMLADSASSFTGTLTVRSTDWAALGTLTVGELAEIGGRYYLARTKNGFLSLQIWTEMPTILTDPETVYLNTTWSELDFGTVVTIDGGGTATVGYDAFAEMDAASEAVAENGTIVITGCDAAIPGSVKWNVEVAAGASVTDYTVASQGRLTLKSGSSARDVAVLPGGTVTVEAGATLTVTKSFSNSGTVTVDGTFNFDISGSTGGTQAYLNSVSGLNGAPTFTLTVGGGQANAAYRLASSAITDNKDFVLTVVDGTGAVLGTVALRYTLQENGSYQENRTDAVIDGKRYTLRNISSGNSSDRGVFLTVSNASDKPAYVYVDASWSGKTAGDTITVRNPDTNLTDSVMFGTDAFATLEDAIAAGDAACTITISGGTFSPAEILARNVVLKDSAVLENATVSRSLTVNGGAANDLTVAAGGSLTMNGGTVSRAVFAAGSTVTVKTGVFCFDVSGLQPGGAALFDGLTYVSGTPECTILISAERAQGVYLLGANAAGFAPSFTIRVKSEQSESTLATLTVGETYREDGVSYTVAETDGALTLTVGSYEVVDTVYVNTAWAGFSYGDTVTLNDGGTATFGVDAFTTIRDAYGVAISGGTVYLEGGTFSLTDMSVDKTRKTVARAGSVVSGAQGWNRRSIDLTLESGAAADSFKFECGTLTVNAGARLTGESRTEQGVSLVLYDGAILDGTLTMSGKLTMRDVTSLGGTLVIENGGTLTGTATFTADMDITVNGVIDFDISGSTAGDPTLFRGLSFVKGAPSNYNIKVSSSQAAGVYALAEYASRFTGSIRVSNENSGMIGDLITVGGSFIYDGKSYSLNGEYVGDTYVLSLAIEELPPREYVYVNNSAWKITTPRGTVVKVPGGTAVYGYDAFWNLSAAFTVSDTTICITGGSFSLWDGVNDSSRTYSQDVIVSGGTLKVEGADRTSKYTGCISVVRNGFLSIRGADAVNASVIVDETGTLTLSVSNEGPSVEAVSITVDGCLEFDLTDTRTSAPAVFRDLSRIQGAPTTYAIRQDYDEIGTGTYLVATNAARVGQQIELRLGTNRYTLDIGGSGVALNGRYYKAVMTEDDSLVLQVETPTIVYVNRDFVNYPTYSTVPTKSGGTATYAGDAWQDITVALKRISPGTMLVLEKGEMQVHYNDAYNLTAVPTDLDLSITVLDEVNLSFVSFQVNSGRFFRVSGGRVTGDVTISSGASFTVGEGGIVTGDVTISTGASFTVEAGSTLYGRFVFRDGANVTVNGVMHFSLANMAAGGEALLTGLARNKGTATYLLGIGRAQQEGTYILSSESGTFDGYILIENSVGAVIGSVAVGETVRVGKRTYTLAADASDNLNITISYLEKSGIVHLDSAWSVRTEGEWLEPEEGVAACIGYDAFDTAAEAFDELGAGGTLVVRGGTHSRSGDLGNAANAVIRGGEFSLNGTLGDGRTITVCAGGTLSGDLVVSSGATITVEAGGTLAAGHITVEAGATVTVEAGASLTVAGDIDFRLLGIDPNAGPLFRGLSLVQGAPSFSLTVDWSDLGGTYVLASDAGQFDGVLTVRDTDGTELGTLSVGDILVYDYTLYTLTNTDAGELCLVVSRPDRVTVNSDWAGLEAGTTVVLQSGLTATIGYDAFADAADAFVRLGRDGTVVFEKGKLDSLDAETACRNIIVIGDLGVDSFTLGSGMTVTVGAGARLSGFITVESGGTLTVEAGGTLSVTNYNILEGASVVVNGVLDFDMTNAPCRGKYYTHLIPEDRYCFGYDFIRGNATYTITVDAERMVLKHPLMKSIYALGDSFSVLLNTYTVLDVTGEVLGVLDVSNLVYPDNCPFKIVLDEEGANYGYYYLPAPLKCAAPFVSSEWEGLEDGTTVLVVDENGDTVEAVIGQNAFATFAPAAELATEYDGKVQVAGYVETGDVSWHTIVLEGGTLSCGGSTLKRGVQLAYGSTLENVVIDYDSAVLTVGATSYGSGVVTIRNITMKGQPGSALGGSMHINAKTTLTGFMTFEGGGFVGGSCPTIDFDLSVAVESRALAENLNYQIAHTNIMTMGPNDGAKYTITLADEPAAGTRTYKLASNASDFGSRVITVKNRVGDELGTISVGGSLTLDGVVYSLQLGADGLLALKSVSPNGDNTPPVIVSVTAGPDAPTNGDVTLTVQVTDDGQVRAVFYRFGEDGEWQEYDLANGQTVTQNGVVYFKAVDLAGNVSEIVGCTVGNIDRTPPELPGSLRAGVSGSMAALNWNASQDASGIDAYYVTYRNGEQEYTVSTTAAGIALEDLAVGTWTWSVRAVDSAGNVSEFANGGSFTVTDEVVPEDEKRFFVGDFAGSGRPVLAKVSGGVVAIPVENGGLWGSLALEDGWSVAGVGDFDGDGKDDILRINAAGYVVGEMSNGDGSFTAQVLNFRGAGWDILGVGDFDGDGKDDVLVANPTGASDTVGLLGYWKSGTEWTLINGYSATWEMISTGDFDGDGKCDMLWRNSFDGADGRTYNAYCTWILDPASGETDWRMVSVAAPDEWNYLCSGDFDGDGTDDIAMINMEGVVGIWGVKNGWLNSWSIVSAVDTSEWKLVGVGDFDGDGTDDIAWRNPEAGIAGCWQIEQKQLASWQPLAILA